MSHSPIFIGSILTVRLGRVWAAASRNGLIALDFGVSRPQFEDAVRGQTKREPTYAPHRLRKVMQQVREYLAGKRRHFEVPVHWSMLASDFQRRTLRTVFSIPYGETRTYGQIARQMGRPQAYRAVGHSNATNPMPLIIPCHRVIGSDGKLHGYGGAGGLNTKAWLLRMERDGQK